VTDAPNWKWWWSSSEEGPYSGPFDSREAAIEAAIDDGTCEGLGDQTVIHICEAYQTPIRLVQHFDMERWVEGVDDDLYELGDPDGDGVLAQVKREDWDRLEVAIKDAITAWQDDTERPIMIIPWAFTNQRNLEVVIVPPASESE
jgi:hypothetical protein